LALKKNLIANYIGQAWSTLMNMAFIPVYINYLGVEAYGLIGIFAMLLVWFRLLDMGMTPTLVREMARFTGGNKDVAAVRDILRSVEIVVVLVATMIVIVVSAGSDWIAASWLQAAKLPVPVVAQAVAIMGVVAALRTIEGIYRSCLVGLQKQVQFNQINSGMATLRGTGAIAILAWVSPTIEAFFIWQAAISLLTLFLLCVATYANLPSADRSGRFSLKALKGIQHFAGGMASINILALLLTQVDKILLSKLLTLSDFGYYTLATAVAGAIHTLASPITQAWSPRLNQLQAVSDHRGFASSYHQGAQLVTVMLGSAAVVLILFSDTFLELWTRNATLADRTGSLLSLLVLGNLLNGLLWMPFQAQLAHGWTALAVRANVAAVVIVIPAILWVTPRYGSIGAATVWACLNAVYLLLSVHFMSRQILTNEKWRWYRQDVMQPLIPATIMAATVRWILPIPVGPGQQTVTLLVASASTLIVAVVAAPLVRQQVLSLPATWLMVNNNRNTAFPRRPW